MKIQHNKETIMTKCEQFLECQMEWSKAAYAHNEQTKRLGLVEGTRFAICFQKKTGKNLSDKVLAVLNTNTPV